MSELIDLVEVQAVGADGTLRWSYFCTGNGFISAPADDPPNVTYDPRVVDPGTFERHLWEPGQTQGVGRVTLGAVVLANGDGALDVWLTWAMDGRRLNILRGYDDQPKSTFSTVLTGVIQSISPALDLMTINLRDGMTAVNVPATSARYGGTNSLPNGVDGTPTDIDGQFRPWLLGEVENFSPPQVNSSLLIYELSQFTVAAIVSVWEGGNAITAGTAYATVALLQAAATTAGTYDYSLGSATEGCYVKLGTAPTLPITAYAQEGTNAAARTIGQIATRLLTKIGIAPALIGALALFDNTQPAVVGYFINTSGAQASDVMDTLCASAGAAWTVRRDGSYVILRLAVPSGQHVAEYDLTDIINSGDTAITVEPTTDTVGGVPTYEVDFSYQFNPTVMNGSQVAGSVSQARKGWLAQEYRQIAATNPAVWAPASKTGLHPLSIPMSVSSMMRTQTDATAEASRLLAIYSAIRGYFTVSLSADDVSSTLDLGAIIKLTMPRFGCDNGTKFLLVGMTEARAQNTVSLNLWK